MAEGEEGDVLRAFREVLEKFDIELAPSKAPSEEEGKAARKGDMAEILAKTQEKIDSLHETADELLAKTKMTREEIDAYISNPNNFNREQWEALEKLRSATEEFKKKALSGIAPPSEKKKKQDKRFAKKRHWIPL